MYQPKYTISNKLVKSINRIVETHSLIMNASLKPTWEVGLRHHALVRSVHSSTHLEGNPLTEKEDLRKDLRKQEINPRQFQAVKYIQKQGSIQSHEYAERFKCSRDTAVRDLNELVERGVITTQGAGPQLRYVLK